MILSLTINEKFNMFLTAAHLNAGVVVVVTDSVVVGRVVYIISFLPHLHLNHPACVPNKPTVSVDVKHHVYFILPSTIIAYPGANETSRSPLKP